MNIHDTVLTTPEPSACSTENKKDSNMEPCDYQKQEVKRNLYSLNTSSESLGILSLDDMKPVKDTIISSSYSTTPNWACLEERRKVLDSTRALLEKFSRRNSTTNLISSITQLSESTVNESDLLKETHNDSGLLRQEMSKTPSFTSQTINEESSRNSSFNAQGNSKLSNLDSISDYINELKLKFQADTSASFSDIVSDMSKQSLEVDSAMFQPGNDMIEQFVEDEKAWKEKYAAIPNVSLTSFTSQMNSSTHDDKEGAVSIGEFFQKKSDNCFGGNSPIKNGMRLVNSTTIEDDNQSVFSQNLDRSVTSILSLSDIQNLITEEESTPTKVIERLMKAPVMSSTTRLSSHTLQSHNGSPRRPETLTQEYYNSRASLGSPKVSNSRFSKQFASSNDLRSGNPSGTSLYTAKSLNSISNKENLHEKMEEKNRTLTSVRSTSSIGSISDGIPKLDSNKHEMVWGCVKEGRSAVQELTIRNKHNKKVKYMVQMTNSNFKPVNLECQGDKAIILLHPWETRQVNIAFAPKSTGPHVGQFFFTPMIRKEELTANRQHIAMYGYGGHANIIIKGQTRDLCGKLWISLGSIEGRQELSADFIVRNTGTIDGFVSLSVNSKSLCSYDDISLTPSKIIVNHGTEQVVKVTFRPTKNDIHSLNEAMSNQAMKAAEIAVIRMITGADITRLRINKLNKRILKDSDKQFQDPISQQLNARYQASQKVSKDEIRYFNETPKSIKTLLQCLDSTEISLLIDRDMDATLMPEADDSTVMFKTMVGADDSSIIDVENSYMKYFNVEPAIVILTPPSKCNDYLLLSSNHNRPVTYSISVMPGGPLNVTPSCGEVAPGEIQKVQVECDFSNCKHGSSKARQDFRLIIEIEEEVLGVTVSVINL